MEDQVEHIAEIAEWDYESLSHSNLCCVFCKMYRLCVYFLSSKIAYCIHNLSKKRNVPFPEYFNLVKSKKALQIFIGKGFNNIFDACSMSHKQLMHRWNNQDTNSLQAVNN